MGISFLKKETIFLGGVSAGWASYEQKHGHLEMKGHSAIVCCLLGRGCAKNSNTKEMWPE